MTALFLRNVCGHERNGLSRSISGLLCLVAVCHFTVSNNSQCSLDACSVLGILPGPLCHHTASLSWVLYIVKFRQLNAKSQRKVLNHILAWVWARDKTSKVTSNKTEFILFYSGPGHTLATAEPLVLCLLHCGPSGNTWRRKEGRRRAEGRSRERSEGEDLNVSSGWFFSLLRRLNEYIKTS